MRLTYSADLKCIRNTLMKNCAFINSSGGGSKRQTDVVSQNEVLTITVVARFVSDDVIIVSLFTVKRPFQSESHSGVVDSVTYAEQREIQM